MRTQRRLLVLICALVAGAIAVAAVPVANAASSSGPALDTGIDATRIIDAARVDIGSIDPDKVVVSCVAQVVDVGTVGVMRSNQTCFTSDRAADLFVERLNVNSTNAASTNTLAYHFSGTGYSGSNVRIVGTDCGGGTWPATGYWSNNIESTIHYCGSESIRHYDYSYCGGTSYSAWGSVTSLGYMNNRTNCVQYGY